jgi:DNA-binding NarL/FixJ family response regulator
VLVVDDEALIADLWRIHLEAVDVEVCGVAFTAQGAVTLAQEYRPAVVVMDVRLRGAADGVDAAIAIAQSVGSKVVFVTGSREPETIARMQLGSPTAVLFKPVLGRQLCSAVRDALQSTRSEGPDGV